MIIFPDEDMDIDYVLIDRFSNKKTGNAQTYYSFRLNPQIYYEKYIKDNNWTIIAEERGVTLLKKK